MVRRIAVVITLSASLILAKAHAQVGPVDGATATPIPGAGHNYIQDLVDTVSPATGHNFGHKPRRGSRAPS